MALTQPPSWATDTNYDAGPNAWNGNPTKRAPSAGEGTKGKIPGEKFRAQVFNYLLNAISARISTLIDHVEDTAAAFGFTATDANTDALAECINARALAIALANTEVTTPNFATKTPSAVHIFGTRLIVGFTDGAIYTSDDNGATYTSRTSNTTKRINAFADNGTTIVAVCDDAEIVTSTDGATWTARTSNAAGATIDIDCVVWDSTNSLFIAAGDIDPTYAYIGTSPTGTTWTKQTAHHTGTGVGLTRIAAGGGKACAVGGNFVQFSSNGTTWGAAFNPSSISAHADVLHVGSGTFSILATGTSNALSATTTDGAAFTLGTAAPSSSSGFGTGLVIDGALWALGSGYLYRSFDGLAWMKIAFRDTDAGPLSAYGLGRAWGAAGNADELVRSFATGAV